MLSLEEVRSVVPPSTMTGSEVNTRLYKRMKVY